MSLALGSRLRLALAPPYYLAPPLAGIDVSASGVKGVRLVEKPHGLVLASYAVEYFSSPSAFADGEFTDLTTVATALRVVAQKIGVTSAHAALPETKSYLFETVARGTTKEEWRTAVEQHLEELIPLPPAETAFDLAAVGVTEQGVRVEGKGVARRIVDRTLAVFDEAGLSVRALDGEIFAMARALLREDDNSTTLIIDVGKTTTKLAVVEGLIPRYATTLGIGGHAFTLAIQKHFGVTEAEARWVKVERGIVPVAGNEDYIAAMLMTVSAIRNEIAMHLDYWQTRQARALGHAPVTKAILAGGNATVRGLPEYLGSALGIPVATGDVFTNLAPRGYWVSELRYAESLAYATAIGLALRDAPTSRL